MISVALTNVTAVVDIIRTPIEVGVSHFLELKSLLVSIVSSSTQNISPAP